MKKYRVIGRSVNSLIKKVAVKLGVSEEKVGYEVKKEDIDQNGEKVIVLDVWVTEEKEVEKEVVSHKGSEQKEEQAAEKKNPIEIEINNTGVYLTLNGKQNFNSVVDYIMDKEIKDPEFESINEAYQNPGKKVKIAEYFEGIYERSKIELSFSDDKMKGYIIVTKPRGISAINVDDMLEEIKKIGITTGIKKEKLSEIVGKNRYDEKICFAEGIEAVDGKNGYVDYKINAFKNKNSLKPVENENGKVDFKNLDVVENVEKDTLLAVKVMPEKGKNGRNIFGEEIIAKDGIEVEIEQGKNTLLSSDSMELRAEIDGMVSLNGKRIDIMNVFITDEVGISTGNIKFLGGVLVKGDVQPDYIIEAEGNVEIKGNVEKSDIKATGDIIIKGGCFGKDSGKIIAGNDVIINFVESAYIEAAGNVIVNEGIMNSTVVAGKKVLLLDKKGTILGGDIRAAEGIEVINLGSSRGIKTEIEVGINPKVLEEIRKLEEEIEEDKKKVDQVEKTLNLLQNMKESLKEKMPEDKEEMLNKMISAKFSISKNIKQHQAELADKQKTASDIKNATVLVHDVCYPGIKIKIRKGSITTKEALRNAKFYYEGAEVKITSVT